ncbi:carbohydrate ABC transporter permease [Thiospirochaeta perfilievii]|uniref:sn-glycerol-3-phosphate transport system permease protein UgpE n=1 Tax=Thiospirochaeta perfilievii TaxID=252967 RepID=A0A5C1Q885_9SPIO|nr:carbohydrate ABC transporter permease [Thiospirochaeta perfilievii]QEN04293.1 carbohydrate ABC transporter permease [Thiospirochaeta perfilievii]
MIKIKGKSIHQIIIHIVLLIICAVHLYPMLWIGGASLKTNTEIWDNSAGILPEVPQFNNYVRAFQQANFVSYFGNTILFAAGVVIIMLILASTSGYVLSRFEFPLKKFLMGIIMFTMLIPRATTIIPLFTLVRDLGLMNTRLGYILAFTSKSITLAVILFMGFYTGIPKEMEESGKINGCSFIQQFVYIIFPLTKPIIASVAILNTIGAWKEFFIPLVFTLTKPELRTLSVGMYAFVGEHSTDWAGMTAAASISILPMVVVFLAFQRYFIDGLAGSVKG